MGKKVNARSRLEERMSENSALRTLFDHVRVIPAADQAHDFSHILRVAKLTSEIYEVEVKREQLRDVNLLELDSCFAAALLHDCVPVAKNSPLRKESSRLASELAQKWLTELHWESGQIGVITDAILDHSFSSGRVPRSLLGFALQDADRLEALGALGLFRMIATGVSMGAKLFDPDDPWAKHRALDDRRFTIDHFYTKLLKLHENFRTHAARVEAKKRSEYLENFLIQLKHEID